MSSHITHFYLLLKPPELNTLKCFLGVVSAAILTIFFKLNEVIPSIVQFFCRCHSIQMRRLYKYPCTISSFQFLTTGKSSHRHLTSANDGTKESGTGDTSKDLLLALFQQRQPAASATSNAEQHTPQRSQKHSVLSQPLGVTTGAAPNTGSAPTPSHYCANERVALSAAELLNLLSKNSSAISAPPAVSLSSQGPCEKGQTRMEDLCSSVAPTNDKYLSRYYRSPGAQNQERSSSKIPAGVLANYPHHILKSLDIPTEDLDFENTFLNYNQSNVHDSQQIVSECELACSAMPEHINSQRSNVILDDYYQDCEKENYFNSHLHQIQHDLFLSSFDTSKPQENAHRKATQQQSCDTSAPTNTPTTIPLSQGNAALRSVELNHLEEFLHYNLHKAPQVMQPEHMPNESDMRFCSPALRACREVSDESLTPDAIFGQHACSTSEMFSKQN